DRSGVPQFFDDSGIVVEDLGLIRFCSPCSRYRFCGSEVFDPIRNPVKRAAITTGANLAIGSSALVERELSRNRDDRAELRAKLFEPVQVSLCQRLRGDLAGSNQSAEL